MICMTFWKWASHTSVWILKIWYGLDLLVCVICIGKCYVSVDIQYISDTDIILTLKCPCFISSTHLEECIVMTWDEIIVYNEHVFQFQENNEKAFNLIQKKLMYVLVQLTFSQNYVWSLIVILISFLFHIHGDLPRNFMS